MTVLNSEYLVFTSSVSGSDVDRVVLMTSRGNDVAAVVDIFQRSFGHVEVLVGSGVLCSLEKTWPNMSQKENAMDTRPPDSAPWRELKKSKVKLSNC